MTQPIDPLRVLAMSLLAYNTPESAGSATVDGTIKLKDVEDQTRVLHLAQLLADAARQGLCVVPAGTMQYMTARLARLEALQGARAIERPLANDLHFRPTEALTRDNPFLIKGID